MAGERKGKKPVAWDWRERGRGEETRRGDALLEETEAQYQLAEAARIRPLSAREDLRLARALKKGNTAREKLVRHHHRQVVRIAVGHLGHAGVALTDLIEAGEQGLRLALDIFDPDRGFRFATYATWWIGCSIEHVSRASGVGCLPGQVCQGLSISLRALRHLESDCPRPSPEDVAHLLCKSVAEVRRSLQFNAALANLEVA